MSVTTIARGDASRVTAPRRLLARTDEEWRALWAIHAGPDAEPPAVDLASVTIAAAFAGDRPSAGYSIEITAADHADSAIRLAVGERGPAPGTVAAAIITSPFHIVAVTGATGEIAWLDGRDATRAVPGAMREAGEAAGVPQDDRAARVAPRASHPAPRTSSTGLQPRTAATLAYLAGPFSGALILLAESANDDVRFHAWQSILGLGGLGLAVIAISVVAVAALFVSATAMSLMVVLATVIWIVLAIVWALCLWKAWSGERWKLPLAGDYAERFAARV
jgi:uncharacterized membrane protein